jgi:hypothetical protein
LHSLGSLWAYRRLEPPGDDATWVVEALHVLVEEHPLRGWAIDLVRLSADWVEQSAMSPADAERLLTSAVDAGLHEHLANTSSLASSWARLVDAFPTELCPALARTGNKIVAAGGTAIIEPHLRLLRRLP